MNAPFLKPAFAALRFGAVQGVDWNDTLQITQTTLEHGNSITTAFDFAGSWQALSIEQGAGLAPIMLGTASGELLLVDDLPGAVQIYVPGLRVATWQLGEWPFSWRLFQPGSIRQIASGTVLISAR